MEQRGKSGVDPAESGFIEAEGDGEFQFIARSAVAQFFVNVEVVREVGAPAVDGLLEVADHAEVARAWRRAGVVQPRAGRLRRTRDFEEHVELRRVGVLRFVEDHAIVFRADAPGRVGFAEQRGGEGDLVGVGHRAVLQAERAVAPRGLRGDVQRGALHPRAQRRDGCLPRGPQRLRFARRQRADEAVARPRRLPSRQRLAAPGDRCERASVRREGVDFAEVESGERPRRRRAFRHAASAPQLHQFPRRGQSQQGAARRGVEGAAERGVLLEKFRPQRGVFAFVEVLEQPRQAEVMAVLAEQPHAQAVDRAEERAVERGEHLGGNVGLDDALPRALLHLGGGAVRVGHHHERGQPFARVLVPRQRHDAIRDRARLAAAGGGHDGKVPLQLRDEAVALRLVAGRAHASSSSALAKSGCVSVHFSARISSSMASVASG